jgi:endothelin-converting enzyme/putative endopeptidase
MILAAMQNRHPLALSCTALWLAAFALSCSASRPAQVAPPPVTPASLPEPGPLQSLPYRPSLDKGAMDASADACVDFFQYACGGWIKHNPIPADQSEWDVYSQLYEDNERFLWGILASLGQGGAERSPNQQKLGDYFAACMDERTIEARGATPLKPWLDAIAALRKPRDMSRLVALMRVAGLSSRGAALFGFGSDQDAEDSNSVIAVVGTGGLGLPDRDYYLKTDAKSVELRQKYLVHIANMLGLLGDSQAVAKNEAATILKLETELASATLTRVEERDPHKTFHKMGIHELAELLPSFDWIGFFEAVETPALASVDVTQPAFLKQLDQLMRTVPIADWKAFLRWHVVRGMAPFLSRPFVHEQFAFYGHTLNGALAERPRWKRCVGFIDGQLGEALGEEFVRRTFTPDTKARALAMTTSIERVMERNLHDLKWMGPATKKLALEKLHTMANKVGHPERFRDYGAVRVTRDDFAGDATRAMAFEERRWIGKIGKPVDRGEWMQTPATVNAYYNPQMNDINFPAGVLQPPLFDVKLDDAPNYGNTGSTIGHELTHGFDDMGRQFDARGNLKDWWTAKDSAAFEQRASCVVDQYSKYPVVDDIKINSKLTEGEDIADLGGTMLAYAAWKEATRGLKTTNRDGLTPDQRFFVGFAQWACGSARPESLRVQAATNQHSPYAARINGVVANMPEFRKAFGCKVGQPMARPAACRVW